MLVKIEQYKDISPNLQYPIIRFSADTGYMVEALRCKPEGRRFETR
jgi:hypothetical protein